jgi:predicted ATPase/DNA-binding XRE family transcriptional regulator
MEATGRPRFGALLRQFRLDAGMTQQELAERAKLSADAVSTLERGARTRPYRETVVSLGHALDLSPEREALLESTAGIPPLPRRRGEALNASLLRIVRPHAEETPHNNLPHQLTSFVGRQREIGEIATLLKDHRLVTVVGAGGVGKTRIVVRTGNDSLDSYPDGVWFTDLAPLADQTLASSLVLSSLQLPSTTGSPSDVVVAYLKTRRLLLILDNCEHVIAAARALAARIVQSCPEVRVLATSREALEVPGEDLYRLPSLLFPPDSCARAQDALRYESVALFVDRAHAVNSSFALVDENAPDVSEICRHLDGIPLAIELAAARVKVLAPRQIAERLNQRFRLLTGGDSRALPRHQTMTALIDWSYDLLTAREQRFFESLSVFAGSCTLDAVTAVCAADGEDEVAVIDLVTSLTTKSLLVAELAPSEQRYRLLESSRQYARDKLVRRGEHQQIARRHAQFFVGLAQQFECAWHTMADREWLPRVQAELENWRAVLEWSLREKRDIHLGQRFAGLPHVMWQSFTLVEARHWVRAAIDLIDESTSSDLIARLEHADAEGAAQFAECKRSLSAAKRALEGYRQLNDSLGVAQVQHLAAQSLVILGRPLEAEPLLHQALAVARSLGNRRLTATILRKLGHARTRSSDFAEARAYLTEGLGLAKASGAELLAVSTIGSLSINEYDAGDTELALRLLVDVLATYRTLNFCAAPVREVSITLSTIAMYLVVLGRYDQAQRHAFEALDLARSIRFDAVVALSLRFLVVGEILRSEGARRTLAEYVNMAELCGYIDARLAVLGIPNEYGLANEYAGILTALRNAIGNDKLSRTMAAGATMTEDEAIEKARAIQ